VLSLSDTHSCVCTVHSLALSHPCTHSSILLALYHNVTHSSISIILTLQCITPSLYATIYENHTFAYVQRCKYVQYILCMSLLRHIHSSMNITPPKKLIYWYNTGWKTPTHTSTYSVMSIKYWYMSILLTISHSLRQSVPTA